MTKQPLEGLATFSIKVAGAEIPSELYVFSMQIEKNVNQISTATIVIIDGEPDTGNFDASSSASFVPGNKISIAIGYDGNNQLVFSGIITGQSINIDQNTGSTLLVECRDEAVKMTVGRKCLTFPKKKDSDIIKSIIGSYSGLSAAATETSIVWPQQVQYYVTDWDFILALAEANGFIVTTLNSKISIFKPGADTSSVLSVRFGDGLLEFNAGLNSLTQLSNVRASVWDYKAQSVSSAQEANNLSGPGNISSKNLSEVVGLPDYRMQTTAPLPAANLTEWSKAQLVKSDYSKIRGRAKFQGTSIVEPGKYVTLGGLGDRFNGDHLVSGVVHNFSGGNWLTTVTLGLSPNWITERTDVMAPPASGLLPGARGLFNGTVKKAYNDPDSQYRVLVDIPMFDQNGQGIWARLSNFYATSGAGSFFFPEVGDEVILGFLNEDPRYPVILGSLYSGTKIKPYTGLDPNERNSLKAITSKSGVSVIFDDENKVFTIETPNKNTVILSDEDHSITVKDENSNSMVMSSSGITISSPKDITIKADQQIVIQGTMGIKVEASSGDVATSGINIKETADSQYSAQGAETAQVSAGMELMLKAAMIMIN